MRTKSWMSLVLIAVLALGVTMITACQKAEQPAPAVEQPAPAAEQPSPAAEEPAEQTPAEEGTPAPEQSEAPQAPTEGAQQPAK